MAQAMTEVEAARRLVARSFMNGHGSTAVALRQRTGFRADSNRSGSTPAIDWRNMPPALAAIVDRLQGVVIENRPALLDHAPDFDGWGPDLRRPAVPARLALAQAGQGRPRARLQSTRWRRPTTQGAPGLAGGLPVDDGHRQRLPFGSLRPGTEELAAPGKGGPGRRRASPDHEVLWINPAAQDAGGLFGAERAA